jgi:hypothetical protein
VDALADLANRERLGVNPDDLTPGARDFLLVALEALDQLATLRVPGLVEVWRRSMLITFLLAAGDAVTPSLLSAFSWYLDAQIRRTVERAD